MTNACLPRTRLNLRNQLEELHVETRPEWQRGFGGTGWTHCNQAVEAACEKLEVPLPKGLLANEQADYLASEKAAQDGWIPVKPELVTSFVNQGFPVIGALKAEGHGHVVMGIPAEDPSDERIHTWQAGRTNHENRPVGYSWTAADVARVRWFCHR